MFDWIWKGWLSIWGTMNYWSIVPIIIIMVIGAVTWKSIITPREYHERVAFEQNKENNRLSMPKINRYGTIFLKFSLGLMGSTFFFIALFKMFSD